MRLIRAYITVGLLRLAALLATTHVARSSLKLAADIEWDMRRG